MSDIIEYDGYQGSVRYEDGSLHLRILHIDDSISATCTDAQQVSAEFRALVEDYKETCEALGKEPSRPFRGSFNVRVEPALHRKAAMAAAAGGVTLNAWMVSAVTEKLTPTVENARSVSLVVYAQLIAKEASRSSAGRSYSVAPFPAPAEQYDRVMARGQAAFLAQVAMQARH